MQEQPYQDLTRELWGTPSRWISKRTYAGLARELQVDEETARKRVRRLKESGYLLGWRLVPNPKLLDRSAAFVLLKFDNDGSKEKAIPLLKRTDGVIVITRLYGASLLLTTFEKPGESMWKVGLGGNVGARVIPGFKFPTTDYNATLTDWKIVNLLLRDAGRSPDTIAKKLGLSSRTVRRRLGRMLTASAIFIMPMVDLKLFGGVSSHVLLECEKGRTADVERLVSSQTRTWPSGPGPLMVGWLSASPVGTPRR